MKGTGKKSQRRAGKESGVLEGEYHYVVTAR